MAERMLTVPLHTWNRWMKKLTFVQAGTKRYVLFLCDQLSLTFTKINESMKGKKSESCTRETG